MRTIAIIIVLVTIGWLEGFGAEKDTTFARFAQTVKKGITVKLNPKGTSYYKPGFLVQFWYRNAQMNPGTSNKNTDAFVSNYDDFTFRRLRLTNLINIENRFIMFVQIGITNRPEFGSRTQGIYFHDAWGEYRIAKNTFLGAGLHGLHGLSRLSNASTSAGSPYMDSPTVNYPNVNVNDIVVRQYGLFLTGTLSKLYYQLSFNRPVLSSDDKGKTLFSDKQITEMGEQGKVFNRYNNEFAYKGYFFWNFFNKESIPLTNFFPMSYFGSKGRLLNLGAGFDVFPGQTGALVGTQIKTYTGQAYALDLFYEESFANKSSLMFYGAYYNYNYGPGYLKNTGVMNDIFTTVAGDPAASPQGGGISQYYVGTGSAAYALAGYILPKSWLKSTIRLQPYAAGLCKSFEALQSPSFQFNAGLNVFFLDSDAIKLSLEYNNRPVYDNTYHLSQYKGMFVTQLQFKI